MKPRRHQNRRGLVGERTKMGAPFGAPPFATLQGPTLRAPPFRVLPTRTVPTSTAAASCFFVTFHLVPMLFFLSRVSLCFLSRMHLFVLSRRPFAYFVPFSFFSVQWRFLLSQHWVIDTIRFEPPPPLKSWSLLPFPRMSMTLDFPECQEQRRGGERGHCRPSAG